MEETIYRYIRISSQEQNEVHQLTSMREFGVPEENIVEEKVSGKDFNRPRYRRLVRAPRPEDVLVVKSIDRLGRNYTDGPLLPKSAKPPLRRWTCPRRGGKK